MSILLLIVWWLVGLGVEWKLISQLPDPTDKKTWALAILGAFLGPLWFLYMGYLAWKNKQVS